MAKIIAVMNDMIPQIAFAMSEFRSSVTSILSIYKDDFLLDYLIIHGDTDIDDNYFSMYLYDICEQLIFYLESVFPSNTLLRTHFRAYCGIDFEKKDDQFISIAHSSNINYNKKTSETTIPTPKLIPYYNSLICASFESGYNLIYSGNKKLNTKHPTDWQDFMTTIPNFQNHSKDMRFDRKHMNTLYKRPLITFGISFKNTSNLQLSMTTLAILDYLKINEYLSFFIDEYVRLFNFDIEMYLKKVVRKSYKETLNCEKRKNEDNFNGGSI